MLGGRHKHSQHLSEQTSLGKECFLRGILRAHGCPRKDRLRPSRDATARTKCGAGAYYLPSWITNDPSKSPAGGAVMFSFESFVTLMVGAMAMPALALLVIGLSTPQVAPDSIRR